jgi:hypothetical protein
MKVLITTYGKTFPFFQIDSEEVLPLGEPKLTMQFSKEEPSSNKNKPIVADATKSENETAENSQSKTAQDGPKWYTDGKATIIGIKEVQSKGMPI